MVCDSNRPMELLCATAPVHPSVFQQRGKRDTELRPKTQDGATVC